MIAPWLESNKYEKTEKTTIDIETQTVKTEKVIKDTKETATQTDDINASGKMVLKTLPCFDDYKMFEPLILHRWDESIFQNVKVIIGNPLNSGCDSTKVVFVEPNDKAVEMSIRKLYKDKYLELAEATDKLEILEQTTKIGTVTKTLRRIIEVYIDGTMDDLWSKIHKIKQMTLNEEKIVLRHIQGISNINF